MAELPDGVRDLVDGPNFAHVATVLPDGGPHSVPVWIGLEGGRIAFFTLPDSRKARNLDRDPRVAISMTDRKQPYVMARVSGRVAERLEGDAALGVIDRIVAKYRRTPYPQREDNIAYLIEPEQASAHDYR
jgi:PPOX class probable F420-dependent enzyme